MIALQRQGRGQGAGVVRTRRATKSESSGRNGAVREAERDDARAAASSAPFDADGTKRRDQQWLTIAGERGRPHHDARPGVPRERASWCASALARRRARRASELGGSLVPERPTEARSEFISIDGRPCARRRPSTRTAGSRSKAAGGARPAGPRQQPTGMQQSFDGDGRLRGEHLRRARQDHARASARRARRRRPRRRGVRGRIAKGGGTMIDAATRSGSSTMSSSAPAVRGACWPAG